MRKTKGPSPVIGWNHDWNVSMIWMNSNGIFMNKMQDVKGLIWRLDQFISILWGSDQQKWNIAYIWKMMSCFPIFFQHISDISPFFHSFCCINLHVCGPATPKDGFKLQLPGCPSWRRHPSCLPRAFEAMDWEIWNETLWNPMKTMGKCWLNGDLMVVVMGYTLW